jgi:hypothetical protein
MAHGTSGKCDDWDNNQLRHKIIDGEAQLEVLPSYSGKYRLREETAIATVTAKRPAQTKW